MMKHGLILITFLLLMAACSTEDVSQRKVDTTNELSPQSITLEQTETIAKKEVIEGNQDIKLVNNENNDNVEMQSHLFDSSQTGDENEKQNEIPSLSHGPSETLVDENVNEIPSPSHEPSEPLVDENEETPAEDFIMIGDSKYINLMHAEKFQAWITVAVKYGATLYAIPYSDVFAIVKDDEVLVGMSTGVASATSNNIDILCDLMLDKSESAEKMIEGIKHVAQTGESVQLVGPEEFGDDFTIMKQDEWIVISW